MGISWKLLTVLLSFFALESCTYTTKPYPVCNLRVCQGGSSCEVTKTDFDGIAALLERQHMGKLDILKLANGYVVFGATSRGHNAIEKIWPEFACLSTLTPMTDPQYKAYEPCIRNMPKWTELLRSKTIDELLIDKDFRRACMHSAD